MKQIPVAVQLFSLREEVEKDFEGTLKRVSELGYQGVELAGYGGLTIKVLKALLSKYGLQAAGSHVPLEELISNLDQVIQDQKQLGSSFIVCPFLPPDQRSEQDYQSLIPFLEQVGQRCNQEGLTFCYHNHDFELTRLSDGRTALETIFDETNSIHVQTELDVYWLQKAGEDPLEWIKRYKNRAPLVHLKDMTTDDERFFAELGTGAVAIESILHTGDQVGVQWWIVEQDASRRTAFESIEMSMNYLKQQLPYLTR